MDVVSQGSLRYVDFALRRNTIVPYEYFVTTLCHNQFNFRFHGRCYDRLAAYFSNFLQSAMNGISMSMSRSIIAVPGEAFKYCMVGRVKCDMFCLIERHQ